MGTSGEHERITRREAEVLDAVAERLSNGEIATRLHVSERTVESHVSSLLRKLGVANRRALAAVARAEVDTNAAVARRLPAPVEMLADPASYCGRDAVRARLRELWQQAGEGRLLLVVLAGEAGIGKSRLAAEFAAEVHAAGANVLFGACFEDIPTPYAPFVQAIGNDAESLADADVLRRVGGGVAWARLVPALAARVKAGRATEVFDAAAGQAEVFDDLRDYLSRTARDAPTLLIVEDVHWATVTTRNALRHIARVSGAAPLLIVATTRDVPPDLDDELALFLGDLARIPTVTRIELDGLDEDAVAAMLGGRGVSAATVVAETGGNPLLVREVVQGLHVRGGSLESLLAPRYARLDSEALFTLEVASVLGAEFDADVLAAAAKRPLVDVLESLDAAVDAGLVAPTARAGRFSFVHALFGRARYGAIPEARRVRIHADVVDVLARTDPDQRVVELARHARIALPVAGAAMAVDYAVAAAHAAESSLALAEAALHYRHAFDAAASLDPPDPHRRLRLQIRLGELLQGAGNAEFISVLRDAADQARSLEDAEALAEVGSAIVKYAAPRDPGSPEHLLLEQVTDDALRALGSAPTRARARTLAAASESRCFVDPAGARQIAEEALAIARHIGDPVTLGHVLSAYRLAGRTPGNDAARHSTCDELVAIGDAADEPTFALLGLVSRCWCYREEGDLVASDAAFSEALERVSEHPLPPAYRAGVEFTRIGQRLLAGDLAGAEALADGAWASVGSDIANWYGPSIALIRHAQGRLPELIPLLEPASTQPGIGVPYRGALATALGLAGRVEEASDILRELTADDAAKVPRNFTWLTCIVALADATAVCGDRLAAAALLPLLEPYSGWIAELPQTPIAPVDMQIAGLALTLDDTAGAEKAAARAVDASRRRGTPIFLARELLRLAVARGSKDGVAEALAIADQTGAELIRIEAQRYGLS